MTNVEPKVKRLLANQFRTYNLISRDDMVVAATHFVEMAEYFGCPEERFPEILEEAATLLKDLTGSEKYDYSPEYMIRTLYLMATVLFRENNKVPVAA